MNVLCVIPARYASTRLPGKPLKDIAGKPMICRVYERAAKASRVAAAIVATDDSRIYDAVLQHGGKAVMTRKDHPTGTDRLAEVAEKYPDVDLIINVQGDEPLIEPKLIDELAAAFDGDADLQMATVCTEITDEAEQQNPYKRDFLLAYAKMAETPLEHAESLEQLRALENGYRIKVIKTPYRFVGVDTAEDLAKVNAIYRQMMQG